MSGGVRAVDREFRLPAFPDRIRVGQEVASLVVEGGAVAIDSAFSRGASAAVTAEVRYRGFQAFRYRTTGHGGEASPSDGARRATANRDSVEGAEPPGDRHSRLPGRRTDVLRLASACDVG
jgi:hypothetical protein